MKSLFYNNLIILIVFAIEGCNGISKDYDFHLYYGGDKLILHAYISNSEDIEIVLKKTLPPDKTYRADSVKNVSMAIFDESGHVADFVKQSRYRFTIPGLRLDPAKKYKISTTADGLYAETPYLHIPAPLTIDTVYIRKFYDMYNDNYYDIFEIVLTNPTHYPHLYIDRKIFPTPDNPTVPDLPWEEPETPNPLYGNKFSPNLYIRLPQQSATTYHYSDHQILGVPENADSVQILLYTLSEDMGKFLESIKYYDGSVSDFNYERPYPVFSNIMGGYGIFGTYTKTVYKTTIRQ